MKKFVYLIGVVMCIFSILVFFNAAKVEATAQIESKTNVDVTFIQGDQKSSGSNNQMSDTTDSVNSKNDHILSGLLPETGEQAAIYGVIVGICFLILALLGFRIYKKRSEE